MSDPLPIIGLIVTLLGSAIGITKYIHSTLTALSEKIDTRLDAMDRMVSELRTEIKVAAESDRNQFIRLDAWCKDHQDKIKQLGIDIRRSEGVQNAQLNAVRQDIQKNRDTVQDVQMFLSKEFSYRIPRDGR